MSSGKNSSNITNRKEELAPVVTYKIKKRHPEIVQVAGHVQNHLKRRSRAYS